MKYGDELLDLTGRDVSVARAVSRLTPAPLVNFYAGLIISIYPATSLGPVLTPLTNMLICIILMVVLPLAPIIYQAWRGKVDLDVSSREMRARFFVFALMCYALAYAVYWVTFCDEMRVLAAAYFFVTLGVMLATYISKVSVHATGVGGPGTAMLYIYGVSAFPVAFLWMAVVWARPKLKQHTTMQTIAGLLLGILITWCTYTVLYLA